MSSLETLIGRIKSLNSITQRRICALIGATVADVATRPLHWVYNLRQLSQIIGTSTQPEFWPESKSPYYTIPLGLPSCYNDGGLVTLASLNANNRTLNMHHLCESFKQRFGPGTEYYNGYIRRNKDDFVYPLEGPWVNKAIIKFLNKYKTQGVSENLGDKEIVEYDGWCAALPLIIQLSGQPEMWTEASKITNMFNTNINVTRMFHASALYVENYIMGVSDPIQETNDAISSLYPDVHQLMMETEGARDLPFVPAVAQFGRACYLPGSFQGSLLAILQTSSFVDAVRLNIRGGGCSSGRANMIGACYGAKYGIDGIPLDWLQKVDGIEKIMELAINLYDV